MAWLIGSTLLLAAALGDVSLELLRQARDSAQLDALESAQRSPAPWVRAPQANDRDARLQTQFAQQTARRLQAPWAGLLGALEGTPVNVALLVVEPASAQRTVVITAEAAGADEMLAYLKQLQLDPRLHDVHLLSHTVQEQMPATPMRFQLEGSWNSAELSSARGDTP
jgi:hypothetical protein